MDARVAQWIGKRESQQDAYAVKHYPQGTLVVVCDGMGGHDDGAKAARVAADAFADAFSASMTIPVRERLQQALDVANKAVEAIFRGNKYGGTTLTAAFIGGGVIWWVSVGDSPLFLWRRKRLLRLNADHSMRAIYEEFVRSGTMTQEAAMRKGHMLRSAVTGEHLEMVDVSVTPWPLLPGDRLILATDGVDSLLLPTELAPETRDMLGARGGSLAASIVEACRALQDEYADNVTVVTLDWQ
ncbi:MAG: protein phosphatase 2C domain-containing protein [Akkermansia sp.]|nr:protein phosphatase 2C domain-containing protein [Akkermansia sp.]